MRCKQNFLLRIDARTALRVFDRLVLMHDLFWLCCANSSCRLSASEKNGLSLATVQRRVFDSYWKVGDSTEADAYVPMLKLDVADLRRLLPHAASSTQGKHACELL